MSCKLDLSSDTRLRPLNEPRSIKVTAGPDGEPRTVTLKGKRLAVLEVQDRWRIDDLWWRQPLSRIYFEAVLADGRLLTLFHDLGDDTWAAQRYA